MNTDKSIWLEIDITDINFFALAKAILPQCEYPVRCLKPNEVRDILKTVPSQQKWTQKSYKKRNES